MEIRELRESLRDGFNGPSNGWAAAKLLSNGYGTAQFYDNLANDPKHGSEEIVLQLSRIIDIVQKDDLFHAAYRSIGRRR